MKRQNVHVAGASSEQRAARSEESSALGMRLSAVRYPLSAAAGTRRFRRRAEEAESRERKAESPVWPYGRVDVWTFLLLITVLAIPGCNIVGPASYIVGGTGKIDAEHALQDRPTVVFIDDRDNVVNPVTLRRQIAERVNQELMTRKLVSTTINSQDAMGVAARYDNSQRVMAIDAIGRHVGAEQVIYVEMVAFQERIEWNVPRARAICRVRIIDAENRRRLYPDPDAEQPYRIVEVITREIDEDRYRTRGSRLQIYESLAADLGDQIAKLFYRHEARDLGGRLTPR